MPSNPKPQSGQIWRFYDSEYPGGFADFRLAAYRPNEWLAEMIDPDLHRRYCGSSGFCYIPRGDFSTEKMEFLP